MNFFDHKDLGNHLPQLCPKVVKHPVYSFRNFFAYFKKCLFFSVVHVNNQLRVVSQLLLDIFATR
jgi:hypothetical protein